MGKDIMTSKKMQQAQLKRAEEMQDGQFQEGD